MLSSFYFFISERSEESLPPKIYVIRPGILPNEQ